METKTWPAVSAETLSSPRAINKMETKTLSKGDYNQDDWISRIGSTASIIAPDNNIYEIDIGGGESISRVRSKGSESDFSRLESNADAGFLRLQSCSSVSYLACSQGDGTKDGQMSCQGLQSVQLTHPQCQEPRNEAISHQFRSLSEDTEVLTDKELWFKQEAERLRLLNVALGKRSFVSLTM